MLAGPAERAEQARPIEARAGVGLAAGRHIAVRGERTQRQARTEFAHQSRQAAVLRDFEGPVVDAFEFDADGKIVAALAPAPARSAGVPGARLERHELDQLAITANQEMRRHAHAGQAGERSMRGGIQAVGEQPFDGVAAESAARQADRMEYEQADFAAGWPAVAVWRQDAPRAGDPAALRHQSGSLMPSLCMR